MTTTTADRGARGYALASDEGEAFWLTGMLQTVKIGQADTAKPAAPSYLRGSRAAPCAASFSAERAPLRMSGMP